MQEDIKLTDRREAISRLLAEQGRVLVADLGRRFSTSEVTIRSDLTEMEKQGLLERIRGGAIPAARGYRTMTLEQRSMERAEEKRRIAAAAAGAVSDGETLFINAGTTTFLTALELKSRKELRVVTNSIPVAQALGESARVILLGGDINVRYAFTFGTDTARQLEQYRADRLILSVDGFSPEAGVSTYHAEEADLDRRMIERASHVMVAADASKLGRESFTKIADTGDIDTLVTSGKAAGAMLDALAGAGVSIIKG